MTPELAAQVAAALLSETDPAKLRVFGEKLQATHPLAAAMLFGRANQLTPASLPPASPQAPKGGGAPPAAPAAPSAPSGPVTPSGGPAAPVTPPAPPWTPDLPVAAATGILDPSMPPLEQARVMMVLATEADPMKLRAFADTLAPHYPKAAALLNNKAESVQLILASTRPSPPPPSPPMPPGQVIPLPASTTRARKYTVKAGDFPIKIALKFGQPERAWRDLVAANPHKEKKPDGNFKNIVPGEDLFIPATWPDLPGLAKVTPAPPAPPPAPPGPSLEAHLPGRAPPPGAVPSAPPPVVPVVLSLPSPSPAGAPSSTAATYRVVKGDSPSRIAKKLTGNDARWPELIKANPQKERRPDGNFKSLQPSEVLTLPASWNAPSAPSKDAPLAVRA
jgi:nucleoid-associated protein YgaU